MPLVRTGLLAIPDVDKQEKAIGAFTTFKDKALKVSELTPVSLGIISIIPRESIAELT